MFWTPPLKKSHRLPTVAKGCNCGSQSATSRLKQKPQIASYAKSHSLHTYIPYLFTYPHTHTYPLQLPFVGKQPSWRCIWQHRKSVNQKHTHTHRERNPFGKRLKSIFSSVPNGTNKIQKKRTVKQHFGGYFGCNSAKANTMSTQPCENLQFFLFVVAVFPLSFIVNICTVKRACWLFVFVYISLSFVASIMIFMPSYFYMTQSKFGQALFLLLLYPAILVRKKEYSAV